MSSQHLEEFFTTYERLRDCLKITRRALKNGDVGVLKGTAFMGAPQAEAADWIDEVRKVVDDLVIVELWAWFERYVSEYAQTRALIMAEAAQPGFDRQLQIKVAEKIESWRLDEVLDVFKAIIDVNQLGHAINIKRYRDYIAHRNPKHSSPAQTEPKRAYSLLLSIIDAVEESSAALHRT
jgi:hypothetical protein